MQKKKTLKALQFAQYTIGTNNPTYINNLKLPCMYNMG